MRIIAIILLCFFGWFSSTPFHEIESNQQTSRGGRRENGKTVNYKIKLVVKQPSSKLEFNNLWIGTDNVEFELRDAKGGFLKENKFLKKDTITIIAYKRFLPSKEGALVYNKIENPINVPEEYSGKAILAYKLKGKLKYWVIDDFKKLPNVNLP